MATKVTFAEWTKSRSISSIGSNAGANDLPFQTWRRFKEAFPPELVARAVEESAIPVRNCVDPFGGSGTTALACQFLGIRPTTFEINPFLADLIEAKLVTYNSDALARDIGNVALHLSEQGNGMEQPSLDLPETFVEPGVKERWLFDRDVATRIGEILTSIRKIENEDHRRLFLVLLGGILVSVSNAVVSGKGRRYRRHWRSRNRLYTSVDEAFFNASQKAISEIHRYANREELTYRLVRGDCRSALKGGGWDLAIFSPPYPNSFDYTDVYNIELWMLGYLKSRECNRALRQATLSSHVQVSRQFPPPPKGSPTLKATVDRLIDARSLLWDRRIPEMVGGYFADLMRVIGRVQCRLNAGGSTWLVVGDSRYAGIRISTADIVAELAMASGWRLKQIEPFRSMRSSAQQGGRPELSETLIVIEAST